MKLYDPKYKSICTLSIFLMIPLSGLVTDVYLPSFPEMQKMLHTNAGGIQLTLTFFLISYGISLLMAGSIVDSFGRYRIVLVALTVFLLSNVAIATVHNIHFIYLMRILQGISAAFIVVGKRAFLVDIYSGRQLQHYTSMLTIIWAMAPITAPFIGGYLQQAFGWTANFYLLAGYSLICLLIELFFSGEALQIRKPFDAQNIRQSYQHVLGAPDFSIGLVVLGFSYGMVMVFGMAAPFIVEQRFHFSAVTTGYCALLSGLGLMTGGILGKTLQNKPFFSKLVTAVTIQLALSVIMYTTSRYNPNIYVLMAFVLCLHVMSGFIYNIYFTYCLTRFPTHAGVASGLTSGGCYLVTSLASMMLIKTIKINGQEGLAVSYFVFALCIALSLFIFMRSMKTSQITTVGH
ncbi:MFS transporter [Sphingobacterium spiritivorum]|uniref:MFS transporter n=1 Tax=Sphingobacterium spiritivorum TaxID=258 RepID=UPI0019196667|nr:MFS transporter [Sphingobacterium spiritivorum]QQT25818.1 MFS transporter [Sphingobacterium spiritivorum]